MLYRAIFLFSLAAALPGAVVIDRIAAVIGKHVIKASDIERDLRLTEFLNREPLDLRGDARRKAAERLIEQAILRDEIAAGGFPQPAPQDAAGLLAQIRQDRFGGSDARLREELARYGLTEDQLRAQLLWHLTVLRFIDQRFRPGVLVTDEELRAYYDQHLAELKKQYPETNSFEALQPKIRASLEGQRVNENYAQWIEQARNRNRIEYRQGAFE